MGRCRSCECLLPDFRVSEAIRKSAPNGAAICAACKLPVWSSDSWRNTPHESAVRELVSKAARNIFGVLDARRR